MSNAIRQLSADTALSDNQLLFVELLSNPENTMTMQQIADELEVGVRTLYRWKQQPEVQKLLLQKSKEQSLQLLPLANKTAQEILADENSSATAKAKIVSLIYQSAGLLLKDSVETVTKAQEQKPISIEDAMQKYGIVDSPKPAEKVPHTAIGHMPMEERISGRKCK